MKSIPITPLCFIFGLFVHVNCQTSSPPTDTPTSQETTSEFSFTFDPSSSTESFQSTSESSSTESFSSTSGSSTESFDTTSEPPGTSTTSEATTTVCPEPDFRLVSPNRFFFQPIIRLTNEEPCVTLQSNSE